MTLYKVTLHVSFLLSFLNALSGIILMSPSDSFCALFILCTRRKSRHDGVWGKTVLSGES